MRKIGALILLCCIMVCSICGCANSETTKTAIDYVKLCNYTALEVPEEEYAVSDTELYTAIQMYMNSLNIEASDISDAIAVEYFNCENATSAKEMIKKEIVENRFYEAARDMILQSSEIVEFPEDSEEYVERMISMQKSLVEEENISLNEYLMSYYEMTEDEFRNATLLGYGDIMILKAIAEKENYNITPDERNDIIKSTAEYIGLTSEEALEVYGVEYFDCILYEEFLKTLIIDLYETSIKSVV